MRGSDGEDGGGLGGAFGRSRQTEVIKPTIKDAATNALVSVLFWVTCAASLVILFILIGPVSGWVVALAFALFVFYLIYRWLAWFEPQDEVAAAWMLFLMIADGIAASAFTIWWFFNYPDFAETWPRISIGEWVTFPLHGYWLVIVIVPAIVAGVSGLQGLHHLIEGFNPAAFQPFLAKRADTPWWLATGLPDDEDEKYVTRDELLNVMETMMRGKGKQQVIERIVMPNGNLHKTSVGQKGEHGGLHVPQEQDTEPTYLFRLYSGGEAWFHAPDKEYALHDPTLLNLRYVRVSDVAAFINQAETRGTSSRAWCPEVWKVEYWHEVCDVLRRMKILEPAKNRSDSEMLVSKERAFQILASWNTNCGDGETEIVEPFAPEERQEPTEMKELTG